MVIFRRSTSTLIRNQFVQHLELHANLVRTVTQLVLPLLVAWAFADVTTFAGEETEFFEKRIRPVLIKHCYQCHSIEKDAAKGGLTLDTRGGLRRGGESGPALIPGDADASLLMEAIRYDSFQMPPDAPLPDSVIEDFEKWVTTGAADPRDDTVPPSSPVSAESDFWAFEPPRTTRLPKVASTDWPVTPIDHFILARMESSGHHPVGDADRPSLLRRVYFDLIGLPPTTKQLDEFVNDPAPLDEAFEKVVDELLGSPHFGERWGRHWLDLARYAESTGMEWNWAHPVAWRYRDYVIKSFNDDKPYDQFLREQIAGDLLPAEGIDDEQRDERVIATGFLAIGPKSVSIGNDEVFRLELADEQINTFTRAILGLTVGCARCHDHKFDPIPAEDYYALTGIFLSTETLFGTANVGFKGRNNKQGTPLIPIGFDAEEKERTWKEYEKQVSEITSDLNQRRDQLKQLAEGSSEDEPAESQEINKPDSDPDALSVAELKSTIANLQNELDLLKSSPPPRPDYAMGVRDRGQPADCELRLGGEYDQKGEPIPRGFLSVIDLSEDLIEFNRDQSGRLDLARWLTHRGNPLTARVMVNRIWHYLFGQGLVRTVDNFGLLGERPTHPELLDHLAVTFMDDGWSVKAMIRRIVLSRTYRLSTSFDEEQATRDPDNLMRWRMTPRRLEAEELRDAILAISHGLDAQPLAGSPAVAKLNPGWIGNEVAEPTFREYSHRHRSIYLPIVRDQVPEILRMFDYPNAAEVTGKREFSIVPGQALYLMNSDFVASSAEQAAEWLLRDEDVSNYDRIKRAYRAVLSRSPADEEVERDQRAVGEFVQMLEAEGLEPTVAKRNAWALLFQALFSSGEFLILH